MATPAATTIMTPATTGAPAEPVPVAFLGRTSTQEMQDPRASLRRQLRSSQDWLPPGWFIAAVYWDVESGGLDLEARSQGDAYRAFADAGIPRDGGMADLLAEAASPVPRFAAVICEDIERSGRDTFNALKLEKKLSRNGIPLFATDEPARIDGVNSTTVLVRRMKQGVAEWFRIQLKEKTWKGLVEHSLDGWNIGTAPYGYVADRIPHPVPVKASQGRTKTRLALDPDRAPVVAQIFTWRTVDKLGMPTIAARLNANPARYPAPGSRGWTTQGVNTLLRNPKYTGHMVYGRIRKRNGRRAPSRRTSGCGPPSPPTRPRGPGHLGRRPAHRRRARHQPRRHRPQQPSRRGPDLPLPRPDPLPRLPPPHVRPAPGPRRAPVHLLPVPAQPGQAREAVDHPDHPRTVKAPEPAWMRSPASSSKSTSSVPAGRPAGGPAPRHRRAAAADRDARAAALAARLKRIETGQNSCILELEDPRRPGRHRRHRDAHPDRTRFAQFHGEREQIETQLTALAKATPKAADPALLDQLPMAGDILPGLSPGAEG